MLELSGIDVEDIATALAGRTEYEHRWLIDPRTGEVTFWTSDTGIDGENADELDELDLIVIDPLPPYVCFQDHPELISWWHALRDVRAQRRAVQWLLDQELIDDRAAEEFVTHHPDPDLP